MTASELSARLDRLPSSPFHRRVMVAMAFGFFFELADLDSFSFAAPGIKQHLGISVGDVALITSAGFLGMFLGASVGGWLADRIGRRRAITGALVWYSVFSLCNAAAVDVVTLVIARVLTGIGLSALTVIAVTYLAEVMPSSRRGRVQSLVLGFGLIGIPAVAFLARGVVPLGPWGWRLVFVFGALGIVAARLMRRLPESPRWLQEKGHGEEAERVVERIEAEVRATTGELPDPGPVATTTESNPVPVRLSTLFNRRFVRRTTMLWVMWVFQTLGFYGFMSFVPTLLMESGHSLVHSLTFSAITTIGGVPGAFFAWFLSDRLGRQPSLWMVSLVIAVCGILYGTGFTDLTIAVFGFLVGAFIQTFAALLYAYTPELYPTAIRNGGSGFAYGVGRLSNILGPFIVAGLFNGLGYIWVFVYIAACWIVVAVTVAAFGPKTHKHALEEINDERDSSAPVS